MRESVRGSLERTPIYLTRELHLPANRQSSHIEPLQPFFWHAIMTPSGAARSDLPERTSPRGHPREIPRKTRKGRQIVHVDQSRLEARRRKRRILGAGMHEQIPHGSFRSFCL